MEVTPYQTGFQVDDSALPPGAIFKKRDGSLWKVNEDGSFSSLSGGGSQPGALALTFSATLNIGTDPINGFATQNGDTVLWQGAYDDGVDPPQSVTFIGVIQDGAPFEGYVIVVNPGNQSLLWIYSDGSVGGNTFTMPGTQSIQTNASLYSIYLQTQQGSGFFGASDALEDQPIVPLTSPAVQDVIDALIKWGIVTQSD